MASDPDLARRNILLGGLDDGVLAALLPDLTEIPLPAGLVLHEPGHAVREVYFPLAGVVSVLADLGDDQIVETATIGRESVVGISVLLGAEAPTERSLVQVLGRALRMAVEDLRPHLADVDDPLTAMLRHSAQALFTQVSRNAACNRVHTARQRAARWLLTTADRMDSPRFELTQHFLAQMLALRRTSVSEVAQSLAEDGCLTYTRGRITITDRPRLRSHACGPTPAVPRLRLLRGDPPGHRRRALGTLASTRGLYSFRARAAPGIRGGNRMRLPGQAGRTSAAGGGVSG